MYIEPIVSISSSSQEVMIKFTSFIVGCVWTITQRTRRRCVSGFPTLHSIMVTPTLHAYKRFVAVSFGVPILLTSRALNDTFISLGWFYDYS